MTSTNGEFSVRDAAQELMALIGRYAGSQPKLVEGFHATFSKLLARPDLLMLGVPRQGNHIKNSQYLYYDGGLILTLDQFPKGQTIPPHDHGTWEALAIYSGKVKHTVYERMDDGKTPGYADLKVIDDRVLGRKDVAMVMPPAEIHSFTALSDDTYAVTVVGGHYKNDRHYYQPEEKSYIVRNPKAHRQ
jgi:predicted metal-dependent enzyme (double-stranded beta helix superfamily)